MIALLDGNVLIALGDSNHVHHDAAVRWFAQRDTRDFATCPITQGTLLRHVMREEIVENIQEAVAILRGFLEHPSHHFWPDSLTYETVHWRGVLGHRQIADAYLAGLARANQGRLATLDHGLAILHQDVSELIEN
jgi:toxin-antitoxin system PIN domain toxin